MYFKNPSFGLLKHELDDDEQINIEFWNIEVEVPVFCNDEMLDVNIDGIHCLILQTIHESVWIN